MRPAFLPAAGNRKWRWLSATTIALGIACSTNVRPAYAATDAVPPGAVPGPAETTVRSFYAALAGGNCDAASRLRQPYGSHRCREIHDVDVARVEPHYQDDRLGIVYVDVSYRTGSGEKTRIETFRGFVKTVRREDEDTWLIDGRSYRSWPETALDRYLREVTGISRGRGTAAVSMPLPPPPTSSNAQPPPPAQKPRPDAVPVGSAVVLERLWPNQALLGTTAETKPRSLKPPDLTPPTALSETPPIQPLPPALQGSIRRVQPANGDAPIALTFDLCEQANDITGYDGAIVDYLRSQTVPATFFAGGKWLRSHPERAMQLLADPLFEVGNHAWTHGNLRVLDAGRAEEQIAWTQTQYANTRAALAALARQAGIDEQEITRIPPAPRVFRFPYGACSPQSLALAARLGLPAIQWDVVSGDAARGISAKTVAATVLAATKPGSIVVMHANGRGHATAAALATIVPTLRARGFRFVTISTLLASGTPVAVDQCYELKPDDNRRYDRLFGEGTQ